MNPKPLVGVLADYGFELRMNALGVCGDVARHGNFRIEAQDVAVFFGGPEGEAGDYGGSAVMGELREGGAGTGFDAEEIDEDALIEGGVLIDENADGVAGLKRFQNSPGSILFLDDVIATEGAVTLDERIDAGIVERADDDVHGRGHPGMCERT